MLNDFTLGWVKLHRKLLQWEWYEDINVRITFIHCLLKANYEDKNWRGELIPRGSFVSSLGNLSDEIGISVKQLRTSINKLERTSELARSTTSTYTMFTILRYDDYQQEGKPMGGEKTNEGQTEGKRGATTKEVKKLISKEDNKEGKPSPTPKEKFTNLVNELETSLPKNEVLKFIDYWTEKSPRGRKMKFEKETTFDPKMRLKTWERNFNEWGKTEPKQDDWQKANADV